MACLSLDIRPILLATQAWGFVHASLVGGRWTVAAATALLTWIPSWLAFYQGQPVDMVWIAIPMLMLFWAALGRLFAGRRPVRALPYGWIDWAEVLYGKHRHAYHSAIWLGYFFLYVGVLALVGVFAPCGLFNGDRALEVGVGITLLVLGLVLLVYTFWRPIYEAHRTPSNYWHSVQLKYRAVLGARTAVTVAYGQLSAVEALPAWAVSLIYGAILGVSWILIWLWVAHLGNNWRCRRKSLFTVPDAILPVDPVDGFLFWRNFAILDLTANGVLLFIEAFDVPPVVLFLSALGYILVAGLCILFWPHHHTYAYAPVVHAHPPPGTSATPTRLTSSPPQLHHVPHAHQRAVATPPYQDHPSGPRPYL